MESRNVTLTLKQAKEWYNKGGDLREVALQAFTEKELKEPKFKSIRTLNDAVDALGYAGELNITCSRINSILSDLEKVSRASAASFKLNIIRKALNLGENLSLTKGEVWYPYCPFITENSTYYTREIAEGGVDVVGRIRLGGETYKILGGYALNGAFAGLGCFYSSTTVGYGDTYVGFLGCASREIAQHFGRYFAKEIFEAKYGDMVNYKWA